MKLTVGMLREIIKEEVARARRSGLRESRYEPSFDMDDAGSGREVAVAEETLNQIVDRDPSPRCVELWAEMWNVVRDEMSIGGDMDLREAGVIAGFPSDSYDWMDDAKELVDAVAAIPISDRHGLRDGHEVLGAAHQPLKPGMPGLGGEMSSAEGPGFPGYHPSKLGGRLKF